MTKPELPTHKANNCVKKARLSIFAIPMIEKKENKLSAKLGRGKKLVLFKAGFQERGETFFGAFILPGNIYTTANMEQIFLMAFDL